MHLSRRHAMSPVSNPALSASLQEATGNDARKSNGSPSSHEYEVLMRKERCCGLVGERYQQSDFTCLHTLLPWVGNGYKTEPHGRVTAFLFLSLFSNGHF